MTLLHDSDFSWMDEPKKKSHEFTLEEKLALLKLAGHIINDKTSEFKSNDARTILNIMVDLSDGNVS